MPRVIDDVDDEEVSGTAVRTGGSEIGEARALAAGNGEPEVLYAMNDPTFPGNCVWVPPGTKKHALPAWAKLAWFRSNCSDWTIITEEIEITNRAARFKATLLRPDGTIVSTGHKSWSITKNAEYFIECAESGAIARCLENAGFSSERALTEEGRKHMIQPI